MLGWESTQVDLVVIHRQSQARNGEIVVALFEDEATVKTLSQKNGQTWLLPANPDYQPIDGTHAQIIGKVWPFSGGIDAKRCPARLGSVSSSPARPHSVSISP